MKLLLFISVLLLPMIGCAMDTFDSSFRYQSHPLIQIKLKDLLEASNPLSPHYVESDGEWKKDFVEQQLGRQRNCQHALKGFFEKLLPTIQDPLEHYLIRKDMLSLVCRDPLEDTAVQISDRFNIVIEYRDGYKKRLQEIISKQKNEMIKKI